MLWMFQRVNYGPLTNTKNKSLPDLSPREWTLVVPIVAMAVLMGVLPGIFLRPMEPSVNRVIERVTNAQPQRASAAPGSDSRSASGALDPSGPADGRQRVGTIGSSENPPERTGHPAAANDHD
jgi:NADH-quinone oxidoreductase subunit M